MSGFGRENKRRQTEDSAAPTFKRNPRGDGGLPRQDYAPDSPIAGPRMTWNADGLHIEDPRLAGQPERIGSLPGCWTIDWDKIELMRETFRKPKR